MIGTPMTRHRLLGPLALVPCLFTCAEETEWEFPEIIASSKYIDYGTWADTSVVCMNAKLKQWDRFIERSSDFLGIAPPATRIRYTWVPPQFDAPDRWRCRDGLTACHKPSAAGSMIFVRLHEHGPHELVHAVESSGYGEAHPVLKEGMAEFLSTSTNTLTVLDDFSERFLQLIHSTEGLAEEGSYEVAKHFVGSVVHRHGILRYREFRNALPHDARVDEFAATYESNLGENFFTALEAMSSQPVTGLQVPPGCADDPDFETLTWTALGVLEGSADGACGDPHFYGFGFNPSAPGFEKHFVLNVEVAGDYELTVQGPHLDAGPLAVQLESCPETEFAYMHVESGNPDWDLGLARLGVGRHSLRVYYPPRPEPVGEAEISLKLRNLP